MSQDEKFNTTRFWIYWTGTIIMIGWTLKTHISAAAVRVIGLGCNFNNSTLSPDVLIWRERKLEYMFISYLLVLFTLVLLFEPREEISIPGIMVNPSQLIRWLQCNLPLLENQLKNGVTQQQWSRGAFTLLMTDINMCSPPKWQCAKSTKMFPVGA